MQQSCLHISTKGDQVQTVAMQLNFQHHSKLGVTIPGGFSVTTSTYSFTDYSCAEHLTGSGITREYYCSWGGNNLTTVIFTHNFNSLLTDSRPKPVARIKKRGLLAFSLIYIVIKCVFLLPYFISYYI